MFVLTRRYVAENYECKFSSEIQAFHFGGSREQVCIHTVMLYYKPTEAEETQAIYPIV